MWGAKGSPDQFGSLVVAVYGCILHNIQHQFLSLVMLEWPAIDERVFPPILPCHLGIVLVIIIDFGNCWSAAVPATGWYLVVLRCDALPFLALFLVKLSLCLDELLHLSGSAIEMTVLVYLEIAVVPGHLVALVGLHVVAHGEEGCWLGKEGEEGCDGWPADHHNYKLIVKII